MIAVYLYIFVKRCSIIRLSHSPTVHLVRSHDLSPWPATNIDDWSSKCCQLLNVKAQKVNQSTSVESSRP